MTSCRCPCPIYWSHVLSREWRCSWSSADRRCSNNIWVINNYISYYGAAYIRHLMVVYLSMVHTFKPKQKGQHFANEIFGSIFLKWNFKTIWNKITTKIYSWYYTWQRMYGYICVTWPQFVSCLRNILLTPCLKQTSIHQIMCLRIASKNDYD